MSARICTRCGEKPREGHTGFRFFAKLGAWLCDQCWDRYCR